MPTASREGSAALQTKHGGMIYGSRSARVGPRVRLDDAIEQDPCAHRPALLPPLHPRSSLFASFWTVFLTNQRIDHVYCANRRRAEADTRGRAEAHSWKLMRKEEGAGLAPLGRSKAPVWLRPYHLTSKSVFHILVNVLTYEFCLSHFHLQFQLLTLWS